MKEISGLKLAEGLTPHEVRKNGWTEEQPIEGIFEKKDKHAVVVYGPNPLDNEISFLHKPLPGGDEVYGLFHAHHTDEENTWAASHAKSVSSHGLYLNVDEVGELPHAVDNLSLKIDQAHSVIYQKNQTAEITQSLASAALVRIIRRVEDGEKHRNFIVSANLGKGMAFKVPKDYAEEKIEPLFVEHVDNDGDVLMPVMGEEGVDIAPHPPIEAKEGDMVVMLSGPVKPDLMGDNNVYEDIRRVVEEGSNTLEMAAMLADKRKKIGQACLAAVIEI